MLEPYQIEFFKELEKEKDSRPQLPAYAPEIEDIKEEPENTEILL